MDKVAGMEMFVRVVEAGSFAAAAAASDVSATMVAKRVSAIERRIGARLLHRTTRRHQLTEVGRLYYERCKIALAEVDRAEASALELQASPRGRLRIVAPVGFGAEVLVPALSTYLEQNPEVSVELTLDNGAPDIIGEGYDLGICMGGIDAPALVARPLRPYRRILAAAPTYVARRGRPQSPAELGAHDWLGSPIGDTTIVGGSRARAGPNATYQSRAASPRTMAAPCAPPRSTGPVSSCSRR